MRKTGQLWVLAALVFAVLMGTACAGVQTPTAPQAIAEEGLPVGVGDVPDYVTPAQQEGPYYPLEKPVDRDNDLLFVAGSQESAAGDVLSLAGVVYDTRGAPVEGVTVEIWQTDSNGIYLHPDDPNTNRRDPHFQFYGEAVTGADGVYSFRTVLPGLYEPRPRHIHVKVLRQAEVLLTTQFYFANEITLSGEEANLLIDMAPAEDDLGNPIWVGARDIVLSGDLSGNT